jgi:hypothetical protein
MDDSDLPPRWRVDDDDCEYFPGRWWIDWGLPRRYHSPLFALAPLAYVWAVISAIYLRLAAGGLSKRRTGVPEMTPDALRLYETLACYTALAMTPSLATLSRVLGLDAGALHYALGQLAHARLIEWRDGRRRVLAVRALG